MEDNFNYKKYSKAMMHSIQESVNEELEKNKEIEERAEELARKKEVLSSDAENKLLAFANKGELNLVDSERFNFIFNAPVKIYIKDKCKCNNNFENNCKD